MVTDSIGLEAPQNHKYTGMPRSDPRQPQQVREHSGVLDFHSLSLISESET